MNHLDRWQGIERRRAPSLEELESVKLRPTLFTFPAPRHGHSPSLPDFVFPRYEYKSLSREAEGQQQHLGRQTNLVEDDLRSQNLCVTIFTAINYFVGVGILGLPYGLRCSGWTGIIGLVVLGVIFTISGHMLGSCQYQLSLKTYPDIAEVAFGYTGRLLISILFYVQLLFDMALYLILFQNTMSSITDASPLPSLFIAVAIMIIQTNLLTSMTSIALLSVLGAVSGLALGAIVLIVCAQQFQEKFVSTQTQGVNELEKPALLRQDDRLMSHFERWSQSFTIFSFSFMGHAVFPTVFMSMRKPHKYPVVINITFAVLVVLYVLIAAAGYYAFGDDTKGNIFDNITSPNRNSRLTRTGLAADRTDNTNAPIARNNDVVTYVTGALIIITVTAKFSLAVYPIVECIADICGLNKSAFTNNNTRENAIESIGIGCNCGACADHFSSWVRQAADSLTRPTDQNQQQTHQIESTRAQNYYASTLEYGDEEKELFDLARNTASATATSPFQSSIKSFLSPTLPGESPFRANEKHRHQLPRDTSTDANAIINPKGRSRRSTTIDASNTSSDEQELLCHGRDIPFQTPQGPLQHPKSDARQRQQQTYGSREPLPSSLQEVGNRDQATADESRALMSHRHIARAAARRDQISRGSALQHQNVGTRLSVNIGYAVIRIALPLLSMLLAMAVPDFVAQMSLIGGIFGILICYVLPLSFYYQIFRGELTWSLSTTLSIGIVAGSSAIAFVIASAVLK